jgi:hypothetical protein
MAAPYGSKGRRFLLLANLHAGSCRGLWGRRLQNFRFGHHRRAAQSRTRQGITILVTGRRAMGGDVTILVMGRRTMGGDAMSRGCRAMNDDRANADAE